MKFPWTRSHEPRLSHVFSDVGVVFSVADGSDDWWQDPARAPEALRPLAAYLGQLLNEGLVVVEDERVVLRWEDFFRIQATDEHSGSISLLQLPPSGRWAPCIETRGTPSDPGFAIAITEWQSPELGRRHLVRKGAIVSLLAEAWCLDRDAWELCGLIEEFAVRSHALSSDERLRAVGKMRAVVKRAGGCLDDYLERTEIIASEKMALDLRRADAMGTSVVEVRPKLEGAPEGFVETFDRYNGVQSRYDIAQPGGGLVHVAPSPAVAAALEVIKAMPGRRLASEEAKLFAHNPFAILGDDAREAVDEEQLIRARQDAGLLPYRLAFILEDAGGAPTLQLVPLLASTDVVTHRVTTEVAKQLLAGSGSSRAKGLPLFHWDGYEIELGPVTDAALAQLARWLATDALRISFAEIMDLDAYSDRVVGFDAKVQTVPYIAKRDKDAGWIPDNVESGVLAVDPQTGVVQNVPMPPEAVAELQDQIARAKASGAAEVALPGTNASVPVEQAQRLVAVLDDAAISVGKRKAPTPSRDPKNEGGRAGLQILHNIEGLEYSKSVIWQVDAQADRQFETPDSLQPDVTLLPHQEEGLAWLQQRYRLQADGVTGCLLADDMGLGKTLQSLCLIAWHAERAASARPCLVVAPVSLLENWKVEIARFLGWSSEEVLSLYGHDLSSLRVPSSSLEPQLASVGVRKLLSSGFESGYKVVLTTYETLRDYEFSLARVAWGVVVCDEAQKIKNPAAFVTQAAKALRADFRIACTGTPVENSLADLWCLFDFFQPGYLGALNEFSKEYRRSIETREEGYEALVERLRTATKPWVLRRMKTEVHKGLPRKIEVDEAEETSGSLPMSQAQERLYAQAVSEYREARDDNPKGSQILALLAKLRMICANPLSQMVDDHERKPVSEHLKVSPKLAWLMKRLELIRAKDEKVIIFTEFRDIQRLVQRAVAEQFGFSAQVINGSTTVDAQSDESRQRLIDAFQAKPGFGAIILSTTAVGFGVNIQAANHVIHFTRPWNPAKEDQATDRAYRIGQTKDVFVYCPTVIGRGYESFEQRLAALLRSKRELSRDMLAGSQEITAEDFVDL